MEQYRQREVQQQQAQWEQARFIATFVIMPHSKKQLKPKDIVQFPWEEADELEVWTELPEHIKKLAAAMDKKAEEQGIIINKN